MYHVESSPNVNLSYPLNPGLPKIFLLTYDILKINKLYSKSLRINIQIQIFFNVGKNTDKDIPHGNFCPTSFLRGNFLDSFEVHSYISQMNNDQIH